MAEFSKLWSGLGVFLLAGTALSHPAPAGPGEAGRNAHAPQVPAASTILAQHKMNEGGEGGEGGEGAKGKADLTRDDVAYLTQLGLVSGHLNVGVDLYRAGARDAARSHMKHPGDELYAALKPAFTARNVRGFEDGLERLATTVEKGAPVAEVEAAYNALQKQIDQAQAGARTIKLRDRLLVIAKLVHESGEEYMEGVVNGEVREAHEYQDALGFMRVARRMLADIAPADRARATVAIKTMEEQFKAIAPAWPNVVPPKRVMTDASLIHSAAARMEIAALSVD